ncbi:DUF2075 domain-containing protein [Listeria kieliensis]
MDSVSNASVIKRINYSVESVNDLAAQLEEDNSTEKELIIDYPTVYIINTQQMKEQMVYVGETTDINRRTKEHLDRDIKRVSDEKWKTMRDSEMYIVGHPYFNKSLTLDIENKLMSYMLGVKDISKVLNKRRNVQKKYFTSEAFDSVFKDIWEELGKENGELFPIEPVIRDSALFKISPFHKLSNEQYEAKELIMQKVELALLKDMNKQVIFVAGEAGTGKTVLVSNLFYDLSTLSKQSVEEPVFKGTNNFLLVNHNEQLTAYNQIASKLGLVDKDNEVVSKPTRFIREHDPSDPVDVVLVDEGHLLWTQGKQAYQGNNQLLDIIERAKVTIVVFDRNQILRAEQYWEEDKLKLIEDKAKQDGNYIKLQNQFRINASDDMIKWIRTIIDEQIITELPKETGEYDLKIFHTPRAMYSSIQNKMKNYGLSRMLATFDWKYVQNKKPENEDFWCVKIGDWSLPWNLELPRKKGEKAKNLAWAEQPHTIDEVGSTFTIQGFDLNYAGVIIGPSVKYRNGKIIFDKSASKNAKATQNRTLSNGTKMNFSEEFLRNELNVLLTRGINGLYIYAVDKELQNALMTVYKNYQKQKEVNQVE